MAIKFSTWLMTQVHLTNPVGDLAREFVADWPQRRGKTRIKHVRDMLIMAGACGGARHALTMAAWSYRWEMKVAAGRIPGLPLRPSYSPM